MSDENMNSAAQMIAAIPAQIANASTSVPVVAVQPPVMNAGTSRNHTLFRRSDLRRTLS